MRNRNCITKFIMAAVVFTGSYSHRPKVIMFEDKEFRESFEKFGYYAPMIVDVVISIFLLFLLSQVSHLVNSRPQCQKKVFIH